MPVISRLVSARARQQPEATAFLVGADGRTLSWRALAAHAEHWRLLARARALPHRARVGLVPADPLLFAAAYLGCLSVGLTAVPVDPRLTPVEFEAALHALRVDVLATADPDGPRSRTGLETWHVDRSGPRLARPAHSTARPSTAAALRPAVLLASSGTTGRPKGIPLSERHLVHGARRVARHHRIGPGDRGYTPLPLFHVNAQVVGLLATLVSGASLVLDGRFDAASYWSIAAEWSPTWLNAVPAVLAALAGQPAPPAAVAERVRFARSASAPLPAATSSRFTERTGIGVLETYGMSEAAGQITANPLDPSARRVGSVGPPVGLELRVSSADGRRARAGEEGAVLLRGSVVAQYLELRDTGAEVVRQARNAAGWLPTGDVGFLDDLGFLHLAGRADDVVNRGGEKIHPQEVEAVLLAHPAVVGAAVVGAPHDRLGEVPVAFVTTRCCAGAALVEALHRWCETRLARHKRPVEIAITDALPVGPTGKVLRRALRAELAEVGGVR